ncbi:MAG: hypothetical protein M3280_00255, partial [Actinomycetota bacterium]|nr:hypothetical protein [Actinomycetota bacterium]
MIDAGSLAEQLPGQRWFSGRDQAVESIEVLDQAVLDDGPPSLVLALARVTTGRTSRLYQLLVLTEDDKVVGDAFAEPLRLQVLGQLMAGGETIQGVKGAFHFAGPGLNPLEPPGQRSVKPIKAEQTHSSFVLDGRIIVKLFRSLEPGPNPDLELNRLLTNEGFEGVPSQVGEISYEGAIGGRTVEIDLAIAQLFIGRAKDGFNYMLEGARSFLGSASGSPAGRMRREIVEAESDEALSSLEELGELTASLHVFLTRDDV